MKVCHRTHQGLVRASNQDTLLLDETLFGVADGMGGHQGGETASQVAVQVIKNALHGKSPDVRAMELAVEAANRRVYDMAKHDSSLKGMGTTITLLWEGEELMLIGHVGDSRAYRLHEGQLEQITLDHSVVAELLRNHVITPKMARNHPYRNVITRAVGVDPSVLTDVLTVEKCPDDLWLICSDGLYNMVSDEQMLAALTLSADDEEAAEQLLKLALDAGGTDNVSFLLARVGEGGAQ